jgi:hypothetical protein
MGPIWGIAMNVKTNDYYGNHTGYCNESNILATIMGFYMQVFQCMYKCCTMFILIFIDPRQINVTYSYGPI